MTSHKTNIDFNALNKRNGYKSLYANKDSIHSFLDRHGLDNILFVTITFDYHLACRKRAGKWFNNFNSGFLSRNYKSRVKVMEYHKSGGIHFHLLLVSNDVRQGVEWEELPNNKFKIVELTINDNLQAAIDIFGDKKNKYGFGRFSVEPIRTNAEAVSNYFCEDLLSETYKSKIAFSKNERDVNVKTCSASPLATAHRKKLASIANVLAYQSGVDKTDKVAFEQIMIDVNKLAFSDFQLKNIVIYFASVV